MIIVGIDYALMYATSSFEAYLLMKGKLLKKFQRRYLGRVH